jgi:peptidoglycan/xylan/chitin deacetylase (PgdA/CDA1 family)
LNAGCFTMDEQRVLIVNYHYCVAEDENPYLARTAVPPDNFAQQVEQLAHLPEECGVTPLLTFDDGTRDVWRNAVPVLKRHAVPALLFFCSLPLMEKRLLNVTKIHLLQAKLGLDNFRSRFMAAWQAVQQFHELDDPARFHLGPIYRYDTEEVRAFKMMLNVRIPYPVVTQVLDHLLEAEFGPQAELARSIYMSDDEILRARDAGMQIGLHTHSHFMLGRLDAARQEEEIATCHDYFLQLLGPGDYHLSYPYGVSGTWNDDTKAILGSRDIPQAYTLGRRLHDLSQTHDPYEIPRYDVNDIFGRHGVTLSSVIS